jgi:hypothetical protein
VDSIWGVSPRESIEAECGRRGRVAVVTGCVELVLGEDADPGLVAALAGPTAPRILDKPTKERYWLRVWGARGLLWVWEDRATGAIGGALHDPHWRVREMAVKVVARHRLGSLLDAATHLRDDPVPRVRAAAQRAVAVLTASGA